MDLSLPSFTVVGVLAGPCAIRLHDRVHAPSAALALQGVIDGLPARFARIHPEADGLLAAVVFEGSLRCAHRGIVNGPFGEDRVGSAAAADAALRPYTVVAVDPAVRALKLGCGQWAGAGAAERDPAFDFYLVASVLEGQQHPVLQHQQPLAPPHTLRNERITAMLRYSPHFAQFFGSHAPMHLPA